MRPTQKNSRGFSLVELIVVIAITGILGGMIVMIIKGPIQNYVDGAQRAGMSDVADTAYRRLVRDLRRALPGSGRVWGAISGSGSCSGTETCYLEYLEMIAGGRYNTDTTSCFSTASMVSGGITCLASVGDLVGGTTGSTSSVLVNGRGTISASAVVVVNNPGNDCTTSSVYCGYGNGYAAATITGGVVTNSGVAAADDVINFAATLFSPSSSKRFQIVDTPVTYACDPAAGTLTRYWNYAIQAIQPHAAASFAAASSAVLATHVSSCRFVITSITDASGQSAVLVSMPMIISQQNPGQGQSDRFTLYGTAYVGGESSVYGGANGSVP